MPGTAVSATMRKRELMAREVRRGLMAKDKELPPTYFYDERGSELFDTITRLPEYYLTRAERALLERHADLIAAASGARTLVELGAGSAQKSRVLIGALRQRGMCEAYIPVDVDAATLADTAAGLRAEYAGMRVIPVVADVRRELRLPDAPRPLMCAFLGSTIGNFPPAEARALLSRLRDLIGEDGSLLLGADLVKDPAVLERAYNDAEGVTAKFNLNVLSVLNRELGADFDPDMFEHDAFFEPDQRRIEMHLVSRSAQTVSVPGVGDVRLDRGESIRTEISCKYDRESLEALLRESGLVLDRWMVDPNATFALLLAQPAQE